MCDMMTAPKDLRKIFCLAFSLFILSFPPWFSLLWKCLNSARTLSQLHGCKQKDNYYVRFIFWWVEFRCTNQVPMGIQMCAPAPHGLSSVFQMCLLPSESLDLHNPIVWMLLSPAFSKNGINQWAPNGTAVMHSDERLRCQPGSSILFH